MKASIRIAALLGLCSGLLAGGGCRFSLLGGRAGHTVLYYELPAVRVEAVSADSWSRKCVLLLDDFYCAAKYDDRFYVAMRGQQVRPVSSRRWIQPPDQLLTGALHAACVQSGLFRHVLRDRTAVQPDLRLTGSVLLFEQQRDATGRHAAVLELSVLLTRETECGGAAGGKHADTSIWSTTLKFEEPLAKDSADAFAAAMGRNVNTAISRILHDIAALPAPGA